MVLVKQESSTVYFLNAPYPLCAFKNGLHHKRGQTKTSSWGRKTTSPSPKNFAKGNWCLTGAVMEYKALLSWLESLFPECWNAEVAMEEPGLRCYILDEGAFIVANNRVKKDKRGTENNPYFMAANMQVQKSLDTETRK